MCVEIDDCKAAACSPARYIEESHGIENQLHHSDSALVAYTAEQNSGCSLATYRQSNPGASNTCAALEKYVDVASNPCAPEPRQEGQGPASSFLQ